MTMTRRTLFARLLAVPLAAVAAMRLTRSRELLWVPLADDLWGFPLTADDVNSAAFGVNITVYRHDADGNWKCERGVVSSDAVLAAMTQIRTPKTS